jgi:P4 family phage/plasmid primase-like protien
MTTTLADVKKNKDLYSEFEMKVPHYNTRCPKHGGSDSVSTSILSDGTVVWRCHACEGGGTIIDAYIDKFEIDPSEAIKMIEEKIGTEIISDGKAIARPVSFEEFKPKQKIDTTMSFVPHVSYVLNKYGTNQTNFEMRFKGEEKFSEKVNLSDATYIDVAKCSINGNVRAAGVIRWDVRGSKTLLQIHFDGRDWRTGKIPTDYTPIYKMEDIGRESIVYLVEGEKCMHILQDALDKTHADYPDTFESGIVTTIIGGSNAFDSANLDILKDTSIIYILPDNDDVGMKLATKIKGKLPQSKILKFWDDGSKEGYDIADWILEGNDPRLIKRFVGVEVEKELDPIDVALATAVTISAGQVEGFFKNLAKLSPSAIIMDNVIEIIQTNTGIQKGTLKTVWKQILAEENSVDYPLMVANKAKFEKFSQGIVKMAGSFWVYSGTHWEVVDDDVLKNTLLYFTTKYVPEGKKDYAQCIDASFKILSGMCSTMDDIFHMKSTPPPIINFINGELHIDVLTGDCQLKQHNPKSGLTHCLNIEYDPEATSPQYDDAVQGIFCGDDDMIRHWHEVAGYIIQPRRDFKNYFICYGPRGHNGKSKLFSLIYEIVGLKNVAAVSMDKFGEGQFDGSILVGKILLIDDDLKKGTKLNDGLIKQISEQKLITTRFLNKNFFQFYSYAAPVMLCNHLPSTTDLSNAMLTRASIIPFNAYFDPLSPETDRFLFDRVIHSELSGVVNHLIRGYQRLRRRGNWQNPLKCDEARLEWTMETNSLYRFANTQLKSSPDSFMTCHEIRDMYKTWCANEGINDKYVMQNQSIKRGLQDIGYDVIKGDNNYGGWRVMDISASDAV